VELIADKVSKQIRGKAVLTDVNLRLEGGNVYGFVGKNGAGKTMLFRTLSGLIKLDSGTVSFNGRTLHKDFPVLPSLGLIIENTSLFPNLTGLENLKYLASMKKIISTDEIVVTLHRVGLDPNDKRTYKKYSLGMKQRLAIAQAIMEKPDVIMLDEPTNSLDEEGVERLRGIIMEEKARGAIILLASHNKTEIEFLSDYLYEISDGTVSALRGEEH
jgi:ABC-2 type transport system ATP-binding protein